MKRGVFLVVLLFIPIVYAQGYSQSQYVTVDVNLKASLDMDYKTNNAKLESFEADLRFFPGDFQNQEIISFDTSSEPNANIIKGDSIKYKWSSKEEIFDYGFDSRVKVKNFIIKIDKKIDFPITGLRQEDLKYTKTTEYIDISPQIKAKANEIVEGEGDLFSAVVVLAEWTRLNIKYDLNTLTEGVIEKSSWVLASREGVCDEITNLFVSFLRSLNIPTKYVSGMAYSSSIDGWGPHAWAEVYFPKYGWVPFDVTFGQYGWVDPSHIKMTEGLDAKEPSVLYSWRALDVEIESKEFEINASLVDSGEDINNLVELEVNPLKNDVAGGSYVPVEVKVKNLQDYYLSTLVFFTIAPEIINGNEKAVLLEPKQEKNLYWIFKIDDVVDRNKYVSLLNVGDSFGSEKNGNLNFARLGESLSLLEAEKIVKELRKEEEKKYKYDLYVDCSLDKAAYYSYEDAVVNCDLRNNGNTVLDFDLCVDGQCEKINLAISEEYIKNFDLDLSGSRTIRVSAKGNSVDIENFLDLRVYDEPYVDVVLVYENLRYDEKGEYEFVLDARPEIYDLNVRISGSKGLRMKEFFGKQSMSIPFKACRIGSGEREIKVIMSYKDKNGKKYGLEKKYKINIEDIPIWDKFLVKFKDLMSFV